jgi:aminopeptidase N
MKLSFLYIFLAFCCQSIAQPHLQKLSFDIKPDFKTKSIHVTCYQIWKKVNQNDTLILAFFPDFEIDKLKINGGRSKFRYASEDSTLRIFIPSKDSVCLSISYHGIPHIAQNPPWDGGFVWTKDKLGNDWLTTAVQGIGSKLWWPSPVLYDDEPESVITSCTYPKSLFYKGNGRLLNDELLKGGQRKTSWKVSYPINTYNITLNIGNYSHWSDTLLLADGSKLSLDYYPLKHNIEPSKRQFSQAKPMLECFNNEFGIYPFFRDGYSVVETPYAGMEHQSCIAYGNGYVDGYNGSDYSGIGLNFDFILIHESGHEWWGNSVTALTESDFWIQEAFCTYAEYVYVKCQFGEEKANEYINGKKRLVGNKGAILGSLDSGSDMYSKGALMLYTLSRMTASPSDFINLVEAFYKKFAYKSVSTQEVYTYFSKAIKDCSPAFFDQYLRKAEPPILAYKFEEQGDLTAFTYYISNAIEGFKMPIYTGTDSGSTKMHMAGKEITTIMLPGTSWKLIESMSYFIPHQMKK